MESNENQNKFSIQYYKSIILKALSKNYVVPTLNEYYKNKAQYTDKKVMLLRHDLDDKPQRLKFMLECEKECGVRSTTYLLVHTNYYNLFSPAVFSILKDIEEDGFEIGLHTNFVETSKIFGLDANYVLDSEIEILRKYFNVYGVACHRNIDYMYNSLPYLQENFKEIALRNNLLYEAYDQNIFGGFEFVNEGFNPHLGWRNETPEEVIEAGKSLYISTHPHWWYVNHAFEN